MTKKTPHILVLGAGSVGRRHMQNLKQLGCVVSAMDPRNDRLDESEADTGLEHRFQSLDAIPDWSPYDGVVIGSPPAFHVDQAMAVLGAGIPVLMEKPLCPTLEDAERLDRFVQGLPDARLLLGYTYRWWPPLQDFRQRLSASGDSPILHARFVMSAHLADWHPWERYQDFFMASKELGGGALLDESHFIDLMYWFFGMPQSITARVEKLSSLEISTDDNVDVIATYPDNLRVTIHLDLFGRPHEKYIRATGENHSIEWCFDPNHVRWSGEMADDWHQQLYNFERNDMFVAVAEEFLDIIRHDTQPSCTLADGLNVMRLIEACRHSSDSGQTINI